MWLSFVQSVKEFSIERSIWVLREAFAKGARLLPCAMLHFQQSSWERHSNHKQQQENWRLWWLQRYQLGSTSPWAGDRVVRTSKSAHSTIYWVLLHNHKHQQILAPLQFLMDEKTQYLECTFWERFSHFKRNQTSKWLQFLPKGITDLTDNFSSLGSRNLERWGFLSKNRKLRVAIRVERQSCYWWSLRIVLLRPRKSWWENI